MQKGNLGRLVAGFADAIFKIKLINQFESVKNLLHALQTLGKNLSLMGLLVGFFIAGSVVGWGLFITIGIFTLHALSFSWLEALIIIFIINLLVLGLIAFFLSINLKKMRRQAPARRVPQGE